MGKPFDMIELTLDQRTKPTVALCKIRRMQQQGNHAASGSQQDSNNVHVICTRVSSTSQEDEGGASGQEGTTGMEIDPLVIKAPHQGSPQDSNNVNAVNPGASTSQEGEDALNQGRTIMDFLLVEPPQGVYVYIHIFVAQVAYRLTQCNICQRSSVSFCCFQGTNMLEIKLD